jgi:retinol dehydrogenase-12
MQIFTFLFARTAEEGSRLLVIAASAGRKTHGGYMRSGVLKNYAPFITSEDGVEKSQYLWELLGRKLENIQPGILTNLKTV